MNFVAPEYLLFLVIVLLVYWSLRRRKQNILLLLASYFFYGSWDWRFLSLIIISTILDFVAGSRIYSATTAGRRKAWLLASLVGNLSILGYFKYFNFFAGSLIDLGNLVGWNVSHTMAHIILPVGISFYTFQTMSYSIDIYRGKLKPSKSWIDFAAFVAFFPQLVAGPIVRAREFMFQLEQDRRFSGKDLESGLIRFLAGFFKKAFIADTLAIYLVDPVFAHPDRFGSGMLWLALLGYSVQIYADFSGYSSMAIGSARILGFHIPENFAFPYLSTNMSEFWRRWHMTMSRFFRDYVYIGLGGNRGSIAQTMRNLAATTLISGLWHGANWTFVVWGGLHGVYIAGYQLWSKIRAGAPRAARPAGLIGVLPAWLLTQFAVCMAWILFRSRDFSSSWVYFKRLFFAAGDPVAGLPILVWIAFAAFVLDHSGGWLLERSPRIAERFPVYAQALVYAVMIAFLYLAVPHHANPFIYFQF